MKLWTIAMLLAAVATPAACQERGSPADLARVYNFTRIAPVAEPEAIPLYGTPVGSIGSEVWDRMGNGQRVVRNVSRPTLTSVLPAPGKATGAAVIVAPGGGFSMLSMDNEGWPVARWLADHGIAAFILKYRLLPTPVEEGAFMRQMGAVMAAAMSSKGPPDPDSVPARSGKGDRRGGDRRAGRRLQDAVDGQ